MVCAAFAILAIVVRLRGSATVLQSSVKKERTFQVGKLTACVNVSGFLLSCVVNPLRAASTIHRIIAIRKSLTDAFGEEARPYESRVRVT